MNTDFHRFRMVFLALLCLLPAYLYADNPLGDTIKEISLVKEDDGVGFEIIWTDKPKDVLLLVCDLPLAREPIDSARIFCTLGVIKYNPYIFDSEAHENEWYSLFFLRIRRLKSFTLL